MGHVQHTLGLRVDGEQQSVARANLKDLLQSPQFRWKLTSDCSWQVMRSYSLPLRTNLSAIEYKFGDCSWFRLGIEALTIF